MTKPLRMQLSRARGFDLQAASLALNGLPAIKVDRNTQWGNPFRVGMFEGYGAGDAVADFRRWLARDLSVRSAEIAFGKPPIRDQIITGLRGKNLACWCRMDGKPCHADMLLDIANRGTP